MCGRYSIAKKQAKLEERYKDKVIDGVFESNYNAAPGQNLPVITQTEADKVVFYKWGIIPSYSKEEKVTFSNINVKQENILQSPLYSRLLKKKRCLVIADGFYEWKKVGKEKIPQRILLKSEDLFTMAGVYDHWINKDTGEIVKTFAIVTTTPNDVVKDIHDRMPVMLSPKEEQTWLNPESTVEELSPLLDPHPSDHMFSYSVSKEVNKATNNDESLIIPYNSINIEPLTLF